MIFLGLRLQTLCTYYFYWNNWKFSIPKILCYQEYYVLIHILNTSVSWGIWETLSLIFVSSLYILRFASHAFFSAFISHFQSNKNIVRLLLGYCRSLKQVGVIALFLDGSPVPSHTISNYIGNFSHSGHDSNNQVLLFSWAEWHRFRGSKESVIYVEDSHVIISLWEEQQAGSFEGMAKL